MKIAATGLATVVIPSLMGMLARQVSPEIIPVCLLVVHVGLFGFYILAAIIQGQRRSLPQPTQIDGHVVCHTFMVNSFYWVIAYPLTRRSQKWFRWKSPGIKNF